jgi:hemoglobin-like flavoprotein
MTPESRRLVQESWVRISADADTVASRFYEILFELAPGARALFANTDLAGQRRKFVQMLDDILRMLDDPAASIPSLAALGRRHVDYGTQPADYDTVGAALLTTLEESLGDDFSPAMRDAWMETYRTIAGIMRRAATRPPGTMTGEMPVMRTG